MSGRDIDGDDWGDNEGPPWELRYRAYQLMLRRSGRRALAEVEAALLALPDRRLMFGYLAKAPPTVPEIAAGWLTASPLGSVCVVGAVCVAKRTARGEDRLDVLHELERRVGHYDPDDIEAMDALEETGRAAKEVGIPATLAERLSEVNDQEGPEESPEARYDRVLAYVREQRVVAESPLPFRSKRWTGAVALPGGPAVVGDHAMASDAE